MARLILILLIGLVGCTSDGQSRASFGPAEMKVSPTFSRIHDGRLEADVELLDGFGDSVKGGGQITLTLFDAISATYDRRAVPVAGPFQIDLGTEAAQQEHWRSTSRTYVFELPAPDVRADRPYQLRATYELRRGTTTQPGEAPSVQRHYSTATIRPRDVAGD